MTVRSDAMRMRSIRQLFRRRERAPAGRETAYVLYVLILATAVVGVPLARVLFEAARHVVETVGLDNADLSHAAAIGAGACMAGTVALGGVRGPVMASPFRLWLVVSTDLPRGRALMGIFSRVATWVIFAAVVMAGLVSVAFAAGAAIEPRRVAWIVVLTGIYAAMLSIAWLIGQQLGAQRAPWVAGAVLAWTMAGAVHPPLTSFAPWGWFGAGWDLTREIETGSVIWLLVLGLVAVAATPWLIGQLRGPELMDQAFRWDVARSAAASADVAVAADLYRARPHIGRSWRAVSALWLPVRYLQRDVIGALRSPGRLLASTAALMISGYLIASAMTPGLIPAWMLAAGGAALCFAGTGALSDGFRHIAHAASAPRLYGHSLTQLYLLHAVVPLAVTVGGLGIAAIIASATGHVWTATAVASAGMFVMTTRIYASAKDSPSPAMFQPVPTPFGDFSGLLILLWQLEGLVISTSVVALGVFLVTESMIGLTGFFLIAACVMMAASAYRIKRLN